MQVTELERDIRLFRGDAFEGVATAFANNGDVLLVDALASRADAERMRQHIEHQWSKRVRVVVVTHYMSDHMSGLCLFPEAQIVAHRHFMHTYLSQRGRSEADDREFVPPTTTFGDVLTLEWGRHTLELFNNPGKTLCTVCVDVPNADLLLASDNVVGNIAYLSSGAPALIDGSIERLQQRRRGRIVPGHMGILPAESLANARHYLRRLREAVRQAMRETDAEGAIRDISLDACVAAGVAPIPFEREWHAQNLAVVLERRPFAVGGFERSPA